MNALKEKLQKSISRGQSFSSSSSTIPGGITILNPVPRSLHGKTHTNEAELLLKEVIEQQQAKENEIVEENEQLRRTLYTVQVELEGLLKKHSNLKNSSNVRLRAWIWTWTWLQYIFYLSGTALHALFANKIFFLFDI